MQYSVHFMYTLQEVGGNLKMFLTMLTVYNVHFIEKGRELNKKKFVII